MKDDKVMENVLIHVTFASYIIIVPIVFFFFAFSDGVQSYDMPAGQKRGAEVWMSDFTYDGNTKDDYHSGGLGQLTDWEEGITNFR